MSAKKSCSSCQKSIPDVAMTCVFCGAKQKVPEIETPVRGVPILDEPTNGATPATATTAVAVSVAPAAESVAAAPTPPKAANTLFGMKVDPQMIAEAKAAAEAKTNALPSPAAPPAVAAAPSASPLANLSFSSAQRPLMVAGGFVLIGLYAATYRWLVALAGVQLWLQHALLVGGLVMIGGAILSLPARARASLAAGVSALLLVLATISGGGGATWPDLLSNLVFLIVPANLFIQARSAPDRRARLLRAFALLMLLFVPISVVVNGVISHEKLLIEGGLLFLAMGSTLAMGVTELAGPPTVAELPTTK